MRLAKIELLHLTLVHNAAAGPSFMDTFPQSLDSLTDRKTKLESAISKLTEKVDAMDSKLDKILSLLLSGHGDDAKKGEKSTQSNPDDNADLESCSGNKEKEATFDTAKNLPKQLTHVASTSEANPDSGKSGNKATSDIAVQKLGNSSCRNRSKC